MKILIIGNLRSGSTSLFNAFYKSMDGYKGFSEPFNSREEGFGNSKELYSLDYSNLIVKLLPWDLYQDFAFDMINYLFYRETLNITQLKSKIEDGLYNYSSNFDKIILLIRKNKLEQSQSYSNSAENNNYHISYYYNDNIGDLDLSSNLLKHHDDIITNLSDKLQIPLTYYEDLYQGNVSLIHSFLNQNQIKVDNLKLFCETLNPKYRYRQL